MKILTRCTLIVTLKAHRATYRVIRKDGSVETHVVEVDAKTLMEDPHDKPKDFVICDLFPGDTIEHDHLC